LEKIRKLILATKINDEVVDGSAILDNKAKEAIKQMSKYTRAFFKQEQKVNEYVINSLKNNLLTYWNESINPDTEKFWNEIKIKKLKMKEKNL